MSINAEGSNTAWSSWTPQDDEAELFMNDVSPKLITHKHNDISDDTKPQIQLYWYRWWILFLFSMTSLLQSAIWLSFSAFVSESVNYYGVSTFWINFLLITAEIVCIPFNFIATPLIDLYGLRYPVVLNTWFLFIGSAIRLLAHDRQTFWIVIVGQAINAGCGSVVMAAPPKLSAVWFPVHERTTATAISTLANNLGAAVGFLFGFMVKNGNEISHVLYIHSLSTAILVILVSGTFPASPPSPPSVSEERKIASLLNDQHLESKPRAFWRISKGYITNSSFLVLLVVGGASGGILSGWIGLFDASLPHFGFKQGQIEWLGFGATIAGVIGGVVIGYFVDHFLRWMKWVLISLFAAAALGFAWFAVQIGGLIPGNFYTVLIAALWAGLFISCAGPLFYEMCVEVSFPNPEATTGGLVSTMNNLGTLIFVLCGSSITPNTMNWLTMGTMILFAIMLFLIKSPQKRLAVDIGTKGHSMLSE